MYLNPDRMSPDFRRRIARWLEANGCRHHVALEPIIIKGGVAEYVALCRKDRKSLQRMRIVDCDAVPLGVKRLRIRIPLSAVR